MIIAVIKTQLGKLYLDDCKVLLDSGATQSIAKYSVLKKLRFKKALPTFRKQLAVHSVQLLNAGQNLCYLN